MKTSQISAVGEKEGKHFTNIFGMIVKAGRVGELFRRRVHQDARVPHVPEFRVARRFDEAPQGRAPLVVADRDISVALDQQVDQENFAGHHSSVQGRLPPAIGRVDVSAKVYENPRNAAVICFTAYAEFEHLGRIHQLVRHC